MKVVISNKAYFKPGEELWEYCSQQTTYHIQQPGAKYPKAYKNSGSIGPEIKWMPVSRLDLLEAKGIKAEIVDKRVRVPVNLPEPVVPMRLDQKEIYDECIDTCLINGKPGFGKTILALWIAYKLGQKTLVICTNTSIRAQWEKEVYKLFGFYPGVIGSGKFNIEPMIVVSNIQTLNKHGEALAKEFGLVIVDEVHHCVATTFTKFLEASHARYKIGLSGTLKRKDGLNVMFKDYFGFTIFSPAVANTLEPTIHRYDVPLEVSGNLVVPWADRATAVYTHPIFLRTLTALSSLYYNLGHRVLLVAERTNVLLSIRESLEEMGIFAYIITGSTPLEDRDSILEAVALDDRAVLLAAQSIFAEGISLNELSCLVLGSLINNESLIEQLAGRVQRIVPGDRKLPPIVVDLALKGGTGFNQAKGRVGVYYANGWEVKYMKDADAAELAKIAFGKEL
ncbi:putative ATP-dependent helicase [Pectobacterium phage My1]|uniref:Putative ATP-dependent helicase n=1 Tax=Pectobacterium phage My1 TaxID=1204539 RepID=J9QNY4_9CAUD|nr:putative ATP-dependent helicase [Pectobacterium phage My1]AFQ22277.1 putative ATP-dependent helicase [Pectobacterium phage My1]